MEILFGLLSSTLCERSNSHLISSLTLLELVMSAALGKQRQAQPQRGLLIGQQLPIVPELPIEPEPTVEDLPGQNPRAQAGDLHVEAQAGAEGKLLLPRFPAGCRRRPHWAAFS